MGEAKRRGPLETRIVESLITKLSSTTENLRKEDIAKWVRLTEDQRHRVATMIAARQAAADSAPTTELEETPPTDER